MSADSSQKFIARNRAPRVQIEYDVELYGSEKTVQLPFVMGVMADLSGKSHAEPPAVADRKFLEIDVDNFDERMRAVAPRVSFTVPNTLTGDGNLAVDITFESMADFSPGAIARKVDTLRPLLEARQQLSNLMAYMDGKAGAEALIEKILANPSLLDAISAPPSGGDDHAAALDALRALAPQDAPEPDTAAQVLDGLRASAPDDADDAGAVDATPGILDALRADAPEDEPVDDRTESVLAGLASRADTETPEDDASAGVLDGLRSQQADEAPEVDGARSALDALRAASPVETDETDQTPDILGALRKDAPDETPRDDEAAAVLAGLAAATVEDTRNHDRTTGVLGALRDQPADEAPEDDGARSALDALRAASPEDVAEADGTSDILDALITGGNDETPEPDKTSVALDALRSVTPDEPAQQDGTDDLLADLAATAGDEPAEEDGTDDLLADLAATAGDEPAEDDGTDDLLADLAATAGDEPAEDDGTDDLLADLAATAGDEPAEDDGTDDLLADLAATAGDEPEEEDGTDDLLADLAVGADGEPAEGPSDDLDDLLGLLDDEATEEQDQTGADGAEAGDDLDDFLGAMDDGPEEEPASEDSGDDLDDLLGMLDDQTDAQLETSGSGDLDDLLGDLDAALDDGGDLDVLSGQADEPAAPEPEDALGDLDDLLGGLADDTTASATLTGEPDLAFGTLTADRPDPKRLNRRRFRLAILGDFSGRSAKGQIETGDDLAARRAILLDPDTVEDVIEGFATDLVLPIGRDGASIAVSLRGLDSLHPDELYENVEIFAELVGLRQQLAGGSTAANAAQRLKAWGEAHGTPVAPPKMRSAGNAVPANLRLSDFQKLIGDTSGSLAKASPVADLMARIVGPHIRAVPDANAKAMQKAVDDALSAAMRMLLHHPEFQSVEAQWRSIDLIARSIEADDTLDVMLYDISAEEIAADLASAGDLAQSGLVRLLTEGPLDQENGRGGYSAIIGLYGFEETPPHADLLGRIARVAAHVDAPFIASISPAFLDIPKAERHPLVARAWDDLRAMPEARHLGLVSPRFLLRRPYGAKSEPIYEFEFEEFTMAEGMKGMLWANPAVLVAILLARSFRKNGASMKLGSIMSLGGMPYHFVTDRHNDQVALPCTERNLTLDKIEIAMARGFMPVASVKGRDEVRLTSFQSLAGGDILGPWAGVAPPEPSKPQPAPAAPAPQFTADGEPTAEVSDSDLDDLLAGFGDDLDTGSSGSDIDADLAALLDDL